jgi:hypothetical protein
MLLCSCNAWVGGSGGFAECVEDLAGDVALDAARDLVLGIAFGQAAGEVIAGGLMMCRAGLQLPALSPTGEVVDLRPRS